MTKKRRNTLTSGEQPKRLIFCCSGASNVGALSYLAAIRLAQEGFGNFSCIAGIGGNIPPMIRSAKDAEERIVIDGCPTGCARRIMDSNLIPIDRYVIVTELGKKKTHDFDVDDCDVDIIVKEVHDSDEKSPPANLLVGRRLKEGDDCSS
jgi:uncharacterized metal-binding protein